MATAMWVRLSSSGAEFGMGNITNVSISGAFLETALQLPVGAKITLESISSAGAALEGLQLAARVVRVDRHGMGLEWRDLLTQEILARFGVVTPLAQIPWPTQRHE